MTSQSNWKNTPNSGSHITMKKKVVHKFSIPLAHAKSVHHDDVLPPKRQIMPRAANHAKKAALEGTWARQTLFQGKLLPILLPI
jgi:hypothetical protein